MSDGAEKKGKRANKEDREKEMFRCLDIAARCHEKGNEATEEKGMYIFVSRSLLINLMFIVVCEIAILHSIGLN